MSAWRREAMLRFPERTRSIQDSRSIYELLMNLRADLRAVLDGSRDEIGLVDRVFSFASWGFASWQHWDLRNAMAVGFYEEMAYYAEGRREVARHLSFSQLLDLHELFHRMLEPAEYNALLREITNAHGKPLPRLTTRPD